MKKRFEITSCFLHIFAMVCMLCDHLWGTIVPGNEWLTCVGRLAFPIFAFLTVEGYFHTKNLKKYVLRLLVSAILSEIPFDLMVGSRVFYPIHQNVLWTFLISIGLIHMNQQVKGKKLWLRISVGVSSVALGMVLGLATFVDYHHAGVLMVLLFYFFRGEKWWCYIGQIVGLWYINAEVLGGYGYEFQLWGSTVFLARQELATLALIPLWFYRGKQGYYAPWLKWVYYGFYPLHLLLLGLAKML